MVTGPAGDQFDAAIGVVIFARPSIVVWLVLGQDWGMNAEPLVKAIISAMLLLEHCGPDEVDPDTAVRGLENMAYELLRLTDGDRREFMDVLGKIASEAEYSPRRLSSSDPSPS